MNRKQAVYAIGDLLDTQCAVCTKRAELNKMYGSIFSKTDRYCNNECPTGQHLQSLGAQLERAKS
ncbi:zinc-finger domain-containing protein [Paenibacillus fonticola]|uniref:zinc-finger domain-containing protein n=1 Tax=Paenibacillus fonticola TaxID=379896 RepID=UPI000A03D074